MLGVFSLEDDGKCQDCEQFDVGSGINQGSRVDDFECGKLVEGQVSVWPIPGRLGCVCSRSQAFSVVSIVRTDDLPGCTAAASRTHHAGFALDMSTELWG